MRSYAERVKDILSASAELAAIVAEGRTAFDNSPVPRRAAERLIEIVGEAAGAVSAELAAAAPDLTVDKAKAMRNLLIHEYWESNSNILWNTIAHAVPEFASRLSELHPELADADDPPSLASS